VLRKVLPIIGLSFLVITPLAAQSTGTPVFLAPYRAFDRTEFGGSVSDPGSGVALEGFYRLGDRKYDFGFRAGVFDGDGSVTRFLVGADFRTRVVDHTEDFPLDGAFTLGLGASFGDGVTVARIPVGVSFGRRVALEDSNVEFVPYFQPVISPVFGDIDSDVEFSLGLGVDVKLSRRFELRVSGALGDLDGIGLSIAFLR